MDRRVLRGHAGRSFFLRRLSHLSTEVLLIIDSAVLKLILPRYLLNTEHFAKNGPIFFYTGNEGSIDNFALNTVGFCKPNLRIN
jgi:hypothetical protein